MYSVRCCFNLALVGATLLGSTQAFTSRLVPSPVRGTRTMALVSFQQQQQEQPHSMEEIASCALTGLCSVQDMEDMMQGTSPHRLMGWCTDVWRKKRIMTHTSILLFLLSSPAELQHATTTTTTSSRRGTTPEEVVVQSYVNHHLPSGNTEQQRDRLKEALKLRLELHALGQELQGAEENDDEPDDTYLYSSYRGNSNHAFDHFVDYRQMAQYESH